MSDVAYVDFDFYAARENADMTDQTAIEAQVLAMSRYLDRKLDMMPGGFAPIASATFYFDPQGHETLNLRDHEDALYPLRSVVADGIRPDYDRTGDYDNTTFKWDLDDVWIWPSPRNGAATGRPFRSLELRRVGNVPITLWPYSDGSVRIEGAWGWAATPPTIKELVVKLTRDTIDSQRGGGTASIAPLEEGIPLMSDTWRLWRSMERAFGYETVGVY